MAITTSSSTKNAITPLLLLIIPILGLLLYFGSLDDEFINEGKQFTTLNFQVTDPGDWQAAWMLPTPAQGANRFVYRPVMAQFLRMQYHAWQDSPSSYHAVTMFLFLGILVMFILLSGRLTTHPGARIAAALTLALHPMFSQSVENVAAQGALLALLAMLGACYTLLHARQGTLSLGWSATIIAVLALIAIGSHEMGLLLPVWLVAVSLLAAPTPAPLEAALKAGKKRSSEAEAADSPPASEHKMLAYGLPILLLTLGYLALRYHAFHRLAPEPLGALGSSQRLGVSVFAAYLFRLFWPAHPTLFYNAAEANRFMPVPVVGWLILGAALAALLVAIVRRWRLAALALMLMLTPLLCLSHWIPLTSLISEQPLAFALPGLALLVGAAAGRLTSPAWSLPPALWRDRAVFAVLCLAWAGMAWQVWARGQEWSKPETLWLAESERHPLSATPLVELTDYYVRQDNPENARKAARAARRLAFGGDLDRLIELEAALAVGVKDDSRLKELIDETMARPAPSRPEHLERMAIYARQREFRTEAIDLLRRQSKFFPNAFETAYELAKVEMDANNFSEAGRYASMAIQNATGRSLKAKAYERYGTVMCETGDYLSKHGYGTQATKALQMAEGALDQALTLDKTLYLPYIYMTRIYMGRNELERAKVTIISCFNNVGSGVTSYVDLAQLYTNVLELQGHAPDAVQWMAEQMATYPIDIPLQVWGARYLVEMGQYERASQTYQAIYKLPAAQGSMVDILIGSGLIALRNDHSPAEAAKCWRKALTLDPLNAEAKTLLDELENPKKAEPKPALAVATPAVGGAPTSGTLAPRGPLRASVPPTPATEQKGRPAVAVKGTPTPAIPTGISAFSNLEPPPATAPTPTPAAAAGISAFSNLEPPSITAPTPTPAETAAPIQMPTAMPTATPAATQTPASTPTPSVTPAKTPVLRPGINGGPRPIPTPVRGKR